LLNDAHCQTDPHKQDLLRGHDNDITAVTFSPSGRILASAQRASEHREGEQIVVWDYESRNAIYRLSGKACSPRRLRRACRAHTVHSQTLKSA